MPSPSPAAIFEDIRQRVGQAGLAQQLDWLHQLSDSLNQRGSTLFQHNAYHPLALDTLLINLPRLNDSPLAELLRNKLARALDAAQQAGDIPHAEQLVISTSFVLGTLVDMLDNPEQPFEVAALMFESQAMFDDWYDRLLEMTGLQKRPD